MCLLPLAMPLPITVPPLAAPWFFSHRPMAVQEKWLKGAQSCPKRFSFCRVLWHVPRWIPTRSQARAEDLLWPAYRVALPSQEDVKERVAERKTAMKIIQGAPSTSQDDYQLNVIHLIKHTARSLGKQQIVQWRPDKDLVRVDYGQVYERVQRLGNVLDTLGVEPGHTVGVLDWNTVRHYELQSAIPGVGAVALQMNPRLFPKQLAYVVNHTRPRWIFVDESLVPVAETISPLIEGITGYVIMTDRSLGEISTSLHPVQSYETLMQAAEPAYEWPMVHEKAACLACFTSGTTGDPKGVFFSHRNIFLHTLTAALNLELTCRDVMLVFPPMFHSTAWGLPQEATLVGAKLVLPGRNTLEDIPRMIRLMESEKVNRVFGATTYFMAMLEVLRNMDRRPDFSNVQILSGASEPPLAMMRGYHELTGATVSQAYGATETTPLVTVNKVKPWLEEVLTLEQKWELRQKHGYPLVGIDMKIADPQGRVLPNDGKSLGEILVRGPWVAGRYHNAPGTEDRFTEDGYWKSGDVGFMDQEHYLKLVDRVKDLVKSGGEWISSVDMENEIVRHPAVLEATVIGVPHPKWEERPVALVVLRDTERARAQELEAGIRELLGETFAKWQLPDRILFVDEIPKTSVGKYDKKVLRARYRGLLTGD